MNSQTKENTLPEDEVEDSTQNETNSIEENTTSPLENRNDTLSEESKPDSPSTVVVDSIVPLAATEEVVFKAYAKRWLVLITVVLITISNASFWINYSPVIYKVAEFYDVKPALVNWFSVIFLLISVPFCFIATFVMDKMGLKTTIHVGAILNTVGGILRALGTASFISSKNAQFGISLFGQTLAAMAQSFSLYLPTKVSQLWFPVDQRAISTTFLSMSNPMGILIATAVSPFLVQDKDDVPLLNYVSLGPALVAQVLCFLVVTSSHPPTPPSKSVEKSETGHVRQPYLSQLKTVFTSLPYLLLFFTLGSGIGLFSALATVTAQVLCPLGYSKEFSGLSTAALLFCGFIGSAITGILVDRTKAFTPVTKIFFGLAALSAILMLEFFLVPDQKAAIIVFSCLFGLFGVGGYPVGLELSVEATYPVEETISTAFIFMSGQLHGVLFIAIVGFLAMEQNPYYDNLQVCSEDLEDIEPKDYTTSLLVSMGYLSFVVALLILFFNTSYKRLLAEKQDVAKTEPSSGLESPSQVDPEQVSSESSIQLPTVSPQQLTESESESNDEKKLIQSPLCEKVAPVTQL